MGREEPGRLWGPNGGIRRNQLCLNWTERRNSRLVSGFSCGCACWRELGLTHVTLRGLRQSSGLEGGVLGVVGGVAEAWRNGAGLWGTDKCRPTAERGDKYWGEEVRQRRAKVKSLVQLRQVHEKRQNTLNLDLFVCICSPIFTCVPSDTFSRLLSVAMACLHLHV